jgi:hypothetical protein
LPSRNELNALAQIRGQYGIQNTGIFWSSSQIFVLGMLTPGARGLNFVGGSQGSYAKYSDLHVRAVRAF